MARRVLPSGLLCVFSVSCSEKHEGYTEKTRRRHEQDTEKTHGVFPPAVCDRIFVFSVGVVKS